MCYTILPYIYQLKLIDFLSKIFHEIEKCVYYYCSTTLVCLLLLSPRLKDLLKPLSLSRLIAPSDMCSHNGAHTTYIFIPYIHTYIHTNTYISTIHSYTHLHIPKPIAFVGLRSGLLGLLRRQIQINNVWRIFATLAKRMNWKRIDMESQIVRNANENVSIMTCSWAALRYVVLRWVECLSDCPWYLRLTRTHTKLYTHS